MHIIVNKEFHDALKVKYPNLSLELQSFFYHLAFDPGNDYGEVLLEYNYLKNLTGYNNIIVLINDLQKEIDCKIEYKDYYNGEYCRKLVSFTYDNELTKLADQILFSNKHKYYYITKKKQLIVSDRNKNEIIGEIKKENKPKLNTDQEKIIQYLNQPRITKSLNRIYQSNKDYVDQTITNLIGNIQTIEQKKSYKISSLIYSNYTARDNCPRLYPDHHNPVYFTRQVRKASMKGCVDFDLKASQLAIFNKLTNCPTLNSLLKDKKSIWIYIANIVNGYDSYGDNQKDDWKHLVYSIIFGMSNTNLNAEHKDWKIIKKDPLFKEIMQERKRLINEIKSAGFIIDFYGNKKTLWKDEVHELTLLSYWIKSYELHLIAQLFENNKNYNIIAYQFDGITVSFTCQEDQDKFIKSFKNKVEKRAVEMNIYTQLEHEEL